MLHNSWQQIEEEIAVYEVELGKKLVHANIKLEREMTIKKKSSCCQNVYMILSRTKQPSMNH
jgi:hypothetical protein